MPNRTVLAAASLGTAVMLSGIFEDGTVDSSDVRTIGAVLILASLLPWVVAKLPRSTRAAYELGRADGYRDGYDEGRLVARPVVVPMRASQTVPDVVPCGLGTESPCRAHGDAPEGCGARIDSRGWSGDGVGSRN